MTVLPFRATVAPAGLLRCGTALTAATAARDFSRATGGPRANKVTGHVIRPILPTLLVAAFFLCTAASCPPQRVAFNTVDSASTAVLVASATFNACYQTGPCTEAQRVKVKAAYEKYQLAAEAAVFAIGSATVEGTSAQMAEASACAERVLALAKEFAK